MATYHYCVACGHAPHQPGQCRMVYRDETNCLCTHGLDPTRRIDVTQGNESQDLKGGMDDVRALFELLRWRRSECRERKMELTIYPSNDDDRVSYRLQLSGRRGTVTVGDNCREDDIVCNIAESIRRCTRRFERGEFDGRDDHDHDHDHHPRHGEE